MCVTPFSNLTDEELLATVYQTLELRSSMELELAARLEHALDAASKPAEGLTAVLAKKGITWP